MSQTHHRKSGRWLVAILASLLVVGHVCEHPAFADLVRLAVESTHEHSGAHSAHHHDRDHHSHESEISCDALDATRTVSPQVGVALEGAAIDIAVETRVVRVASQGSVGPPAPPPLFLLHRSLLI